jgi:hypothetical protein
MKIFASFRVCLFLLWGMFFFSFITVGFSEEIAPVSPQKEPDFLERFHSDFSEDVFKTAYWLDSFFGGVRIDEETKKSRLRVNVSMGLEKNQKSVFRSNVNLNLVLPRLKDRFHFLFGGDTEEVIDPKDSARELLKNINDTESYSSALRYILLATQGWDTSLDGGIKLSSGSNFFVRTRIRKNIELDAWVFRITERLTLFEEIGLESVSSVDFDRKINKDLFFRITPSATWREELWTLNPSISVFHQWDERRAIAFVFGVNMSTDPKTQVEEYSLKMKFRQKIKGDWLFVEAVPELSFPREENFDMVPKIQLKIEAIFGNVK